MKAIAVAVWVLCLFCMTIQAQASTFNRKDFVNIPVISAGELFIVAFPGKIEKILQLEPYSDDIVVHQHPNLITIQVLTKLKESTSLTVQAEGEQYDVILTPTISSNIKKHYYNFNYYTSWKKYQIIFIPSVLICWIIIIIIIPIWTEED